MGSSFQKQHELPDLSACVSAVAIVDPYSSGRFLAYELAERGVPMVCVRSSLKLDAFFLSSYDTHKGYFVSTVDHDGDLASTVAALSDGQQEIKAVIAGCDSGVELADALSEKLGLCSNGTELTWARRDKAGMHERLKECGIPSADQVQSSKLEDLLSWTREREARMGAEEAYPVVVKPIGGQGVFFCTSEQDLVNAHKALLAYTQADSGCRVEQLVLQEFLTGTEYIVDTCSLDGEHLCCAVWRYNKRHGVPWNSQAVFTEYQELIASDSHECDVLVSYIFQVLDALGFRHGPCHAEVMLTPRGPILVEVHSRLHGIQGPLVVSKATNTGLSTYVVDGMTMGWQGDGGLLKKHLDAGRISAPWRWLYPRVQCAAIVMLVSHTQGYLRADIATQIMNLELPSVMEVFPSVTKGNLIQQTIDLNTMAGYAVLLHDCSEQMAKDIASIRAAEETANLYPVSKDPLPMSRQTTFGLESSTFDWQISPQKSPSEAQADELLARQSSPGLEGSTFDWQISRQMSPSIEKADESWHRQRSLGWKASASHWQITQQITPSVEKPDDLFKPSDGDEVTVITSMGA